MSFLNLRLQLSLSLLIRIHCFDDILHLFLENLDLLCLIIAVEALFDLLLDLSVDVSDLTHARGLRLRDAQVCDDALRAALVVGVYLVVVLQIRRITRRALPRTINDL